MPAGAPLTRNAAAAEAQRLPDRRLPWPGIAAGVAVSVLIRLRAFWTPITSDEGGFLAIARAWAHGDVLYRDVWVDRPQGLLVVYRFWDWVSGGSVASLRIMAMIFGAALVIGVGAATAVLAGRAAGGLAAVLVGISASSPSIEGHLANGELLSGAFAAGGLAVACAALRHQDRWWMLVASGVLAGCALSIKQSGYEGVLAVGVWLVVAGVAGWRTWRAVARALGLLSAGTALVIAVLAVHGALTGFSRWWFAFAGYRLGGRSAFEGADWNRFFMTARIARPVIWPLLGICIVGAVLAIAQTRRAGWSHAADTEPDTEPDTDTDTGTKSDTGSDTGDRPAGSTTLLVLWAGAATIAFFTGGQFHRHYWITFCPALAALAAGLICRALKPRIAFGLALLALVPTYVNTFRILRVSNEQFPIAASGDPRPNADQLLAAWFDANRQPGDRLYLMCASAGFYADAGQDPIYPYLWQDNVQMVPGALAELRALLSSPVRAPKFIALYENPDSCDRTGQTAAIIAADYRLDTVVGKVPVLERISRTS